MTTFQQIRIKNMYQPIISKCCWMERIAEPWALEHHCKETAKPNMTPPPSRHTYAQTLFSVDFAGKMTCLSSVEGTFPPVVV
jgi:hypothetical protein